MKLGETSNLSGWLHGSTKRWTELKILLFPYGFSTATSLFLAMDYFGTFVCSSCGEENEVFIEPEGGEVQTLTEDCSVCCRPNVLHIRIVDETIIIDSEFEG